MLDERVDAFKWMFVNNFHGHCNSGLDTLKYHVLEHKVEALQKFGTLSVLDCSPYEFFNVDVKHSYRKIS